MVEACNNETVHIMGAGGQLHPPNFPHGYSMGVCGWEITAEENQVSVAHGEWVNYSFLTEITLHK